MENQQVNDVSPKETTKTWGFRRSTIARREFIEEVGNLDLIAMTPRRNTRQPKGRGRGRGRGKQPGETTTNAARRARGGKRAVRPTPDPEPCLAQNTASDPQASDQAEDSDELTLRELQERARKRQKSDSKGGAGTADLNAEIVNKDGARGLLQLEENFSSLFDRMAAQRKSALEEEEQGDAEESSDGDEEYSDPDAIYCICRQKHNNRFMICCDRCSEWFHGDCVGISEARGRLLEKNGEDYICPSCSPCQSPMDAASQQPALSKAALSSSSESLFTSSAGEERPSEDEGIKGKIRKSSVCSPKKRFKIFQSVQITKATPEPRPQAVAVSERNATEEAPKEREDPEERVEEKAAVPKCIGPGCSNDALPESVYCGHQCIIRHAAMAMHGRTEPQAQPEIKTKPASKPTLKIHNLGKLFKKKPAETPAEDGRSKETGSAPAASLTPDPVHKAMGEQQPAAIASSLFYKSTATKPDQDAAETQTHKTPLTAPAETPTAPSKAPDSDKAAETPPPSAPLLKKPACNPLPSRAKKTMPGSPRLAVPRRLPSEVPPANRSVLTAPPCPSQEASNVPQTSNTAPEVRVLPVAPAPVPPSRPVQTHPNMQMRQNIRRSLTDTLLKRVNDSDDLDIPESEVENLAVNIEREMFNMFYTTDNKYKIKYRALLLSLKDPKNKVVRGHVTPFKLIRLSDQELLSAQEGAANLAPLLKEEPPDARVDQEEPLTGSENKASKTDCVSVSPAEGKSPLAPVRQVQVKKPSTVVSDMISSMLKDTTAEHKAHLFDLKCRICTGQIAADEDPDAKVQEDDETKNKQKAKSNADALGGEAKVMESPASPTAEERSSQNAQPEFCPPVIPAISIVTITRRDPRTAGYRSTASPSVVPAPGHVPVSIPVSVPVPDPPKGPTTTPNVNVGPQKTVEIPTPPLAPPPPMLKSILTKPSAPSVARFYSSPSLTTGLPSSRSPADSETKNFLSRQDTIWKGFLNMQSVAKFVTKGCIISGSAEVLKKDLPDTVHIGGRILPQTVWEYVERVKTSLTKELSLIRFHPASHEEEVAYVSLFSYFNSRRRFGVVSNICNNIKDIYVIPLCANESIPSILMPIDGPGLEQNHPNLLIGLAVCQKLKRLGAQTQDVDEKRPRIQTPQDPQDINLPTNSAVLDVKNDQPYNPAIVIRTTPPESPPSVKSPESSLPSLNPLLGTPVLSNLRAVSTLAVSVSTDVVKVTSSSAPPLHGTSSTTTTTPLQTILNTIFGKKKQGPEFAANVGQTTPTAAKEPATPSLTVDPIIQQYQQTPKIPVEIDDNDRPYDPEEEYDPALGYQKLTPSKPKTLAAGANDADADDDRPYDPEEEYNLGNKIDSVYTIDTAKCPTTEPLLGTSALKEDVAYDPEDDTVFEEMHNYLTDDTPATTSDYGTSSSMSLSEQQKMLEDLNRQIEEQKRQLEEQEEALRIQRAAVGVSMAHFSVSDALMSPPPRFGRESGEEMETNPPATAIILDRDPRQYRHLQQDAYNSSAMGHTDKDNLGDNSESSQISCLANYSLDQLDDKRSRNVGTTVLNSVSNLETNLSSSDLQEDTASSPGNKNVKHSRSPSKDSDKTRQSCSSRRQHQSTSHRRSRHETRRSYHEKRASDRSKGRRSPERSSGRSSSQLRRTERATSRDRDRHHHRSTSFRHSRTKDRHPSTSRSRSTRSRTSQEPENNQSNKKEKSASRQKNEPSNETTDSSKHLTSEQPQVDKSLSGKSQKEGSGCGEAKEIKTEKANITKGETVQRPSSDLSCGAFSQKKQLQEEDNQMHEDYMSKENPSQRQDLQKNNPQLEKLSTHHGRNSESRNTRRQHSNPKRNVLHKSGTDCSHDTNERLSRKESDQLPQKTPEIEADEFPEHDVTYFRNSQKVLPQRPQHLRGNDLEMSPLQDQKTSFLKDDPLRLRDRTPPKAHLNPSDNVPSLENNMQRNIHPRDQFRPRTPEVQWRGPQHRMFGPRGHAPVQSKIPRASHPESFESCRPAGPRGPGPRIFDDYESSPDFGPRGPTSVPSIFENSGSRNFRPRGPSPVSRGIDETRNFYGPNRQPPGPERFEDFIPQNFGPRDEFSGPDMYDGSFNFAGSTQREFDHRDPHFKGLDDSWEGEVAHRVDIEPVFRHPRGCGPPQQFGDMLESRRLDQTHFNDSRHCDPPFDEAEIRHLPFMYSDRPMDCAENVSDENFINPQQERGHRNQTPHHMRPQSLAHARKLPERSHRFDGFRDHAIEMETSEPHFANPDSFVDALGYESAAPVKGLRLNPPQNYRGPRSPSPHFHEQRIPPPRNTELPKEKPCSSNLALPSTYKPPRSNVPNAYEFQNPTQSCIQLDGPAEESDSRPLRRSGPLLPTPPGGPIRFHNPRMQRPHLRESNLPHRHSARGPINHLVKAGVRSGSFADKQEESCQDYNQGEDLHRFVNMQEEYGSQLRVARRRYVTARGGHSSE